MRAVRALHARLDDAISYLHAAYRQENNDEESRIEVEEAIRDIASALLGREVVFLDEQPKTNDERSVHAYMEAREKNRHGRGGPYGT